MMGYVGQIVNLRRIGNPPDAGPTSPSGLAPNVGRRIANPPQVGNRLATCPTETCSQGGSPIRLSTQGTAARPGQPSGNVE